MAMCAPDFRGQHTYLNDIYTFNGLNKYASASGAAFRHDATFLGRLLRCLRARGNLTGDGTNGYLYDVENRRVARSGGGSAGLRYDPLGRLYEVNGSITGIARFAHDGSALVAEYDPSGALLGRYVHGDAGGALRQAQGDRPRVWFEGATLADRRYLYSDERGSIVARTDAGGNVTAINSYDEYGIPAATNTGRFQYTGQAWLPELGLYYYKARMYSPTLGRFMQTDPIGYEDGPNIYAYVANDPVNGVDPDGKRIARLIQAAVRAGQAIKKGLDRITRRGNPEPPRRQPPNPHGSKGGPDHQREVSRQERIAREEAGPGETVVRERKASGMDVDRRPDVQTRDSSGNTVRVREVERQPHSKRVQDKREDYKRNGIKCDVVDCNGSPR